MMTIPKMMALGSTASMGTEVNKQMNTKKNSNISNSWTQKRGNIISLTAIVATLTIILSSPTTIQPAFAHAETILPISVDNQPARGIVVVVGHSNEPSYGTKPGIHDGMHGLEVTISDNATGLPIGDRSEERRVGKECRSRW